MDVEVGRYEWEGAGMDGRGTLVENSRCKRLPFEVKMHQKTFGAYSLEEHSASAVPLTAIGGQGMEHSLSGIRGRCVARTGREEQSKVVGVLGRNGEGEQGERTGKCIQTHYCQILYFQHKMYQNMFGDRAPAGGAYALPQAP